jgi:hypothetical protein
MKNLRFRYWGMEQQTVYDLAEKHDSSLDLIEKNLGKNDLVYELTEIDTWPEVCSATPPLASAKSAKSNRASAVFSLLIVGTSQSRAVPSADAVSTRWPSALNCAEVTPSSCFIGSPIALPVTASQSRAV